MSGRTRRRRCLTGAVVLVATVVPGAALGGSAGADPLGDARARAAALATQVHSLAVEAEAATERYDGVQAQLAAAVTGRMLAQRALDAAAVQAKVRSDAVGDRVRALYESGGAASLYATALVSGSLTEAMTGYRDLGSVLTADDAALAQAQRADDAAATLERRLAGTAHSVTELQRRAAAAAGRVRSLLAQQRAALAGANATVRQLVAQAQAAAAQVSARDFAAAVAAAGGSLSDTTAPNALVAAVIAAARTKLGDPYQWGGTGPDAYDCSGLTQFAYGAAGITLPRVAADQYTVGRPVSVGELLPGDLLFWATDPTDAATIHHVAIYLGGGVMIAAPHTGDVVKVEPVYYDGFFGATRPYAAGT